MSGPNVGARPGATRLNCQVGDRIGASVDVGTGNLLVTPTDLTLPGIQNNVQLGLDYNGLLLGAPDSREHRRGRTGLAISAGDLGWVKTRLIQNSDGSALYLAPDGVEGLFQPAGGGYTSPPGFGGTLVKTGSTGWTLTDHSSQAMSRFDASGVLTKITDRNGQATTVGYDSAERLTSVTSDAGAASTVSAAESPW
ncbi:MAG: RHS repeat domain-containing protein [Nocardioidaceae bacterium]